MLSAIDVDKFNTLIEITHLVNSSQQNIHTLLTHILESATRLCGGEASSMLLVDKEKQELHFEIALGSKGQAVKQFTIKMGEGIAGWVAQHDKSLIVNDVASDRRHLRAISKKINYPSNTMLAVPMRVQNNCIGVIEVINTNRANGFTREDLEWLEIFANQAALAIDNTKYIEQAHSEIQILQDQINIGQGYHTLITKSPVIQEIIELIDRAAKTDTSVLLIGESGVGKEVFAEQIHLRSNRARKPFIRVNCATLPEGLLESELFGHVKGAFTGSVSNRQGRFELADGGTIFLDEIGDLPLSLQAKLLRVIQEKTFEKIGADESQTVNVRILAATNKDIEGLVEKGEFRSDLYYRLNVLPIHIPPLRQRPEDIPELANFFLDKFMKETKKQFDGFTEEALEAMLTYSWPGNIRELENSIERACVICKDKYIQSSDLQIKSGSNTAHESGERNLKNAVNAFKANFIRKVLDEHNWNQTEAARTLDIQRTYLSRLIKELKLVNPKE
jgi:Nif-specific regulatory protein